MLAALRDELFRLRGAVHAAAREKTAAGEEDVVEHDADEADDAGGEIDEGEAEGRHEAAERVGADADAEVEEDEVGARRDADLVHRRAVDGERVAGSRDCAVAEAEEERADEHRDVAGSRRDDGHRDGHREQRRVDDDVAAAFIQQETRERAADEGRRGEAEEEAGRADARDADAVRVSAEEREHRRVADAAHECDERDAERAHGEEAVEGNLLEVLLFLRQDVALRRFDREREDEDAGSERADDLDAEREGVRRRDIHGEEGADGGGNRDAEREIADALAHFLERDDGGDDRAGRRRGHAERDAMDEAHDVEERERRCDEIEEDHEEEER